MCIFIAHQNKKFLEEKIFKVYLKFIKGYIFFSMLFF